MVEVEESLPIEPQDKQEFAMKRTHWVLILWAAGIGCSFGAIVVEGTAFGGDRPSRQSSDRLVIHEWGTFTCLQNELGEAIRGINTDDEPVPEFVHRIGHLIDNPSELAPVYYKGVPGSHRQVRMRLETPVLYFHLPRGTTRPLTATVEVGFKGGWLTEYYPKAEISAPGLPGQNFEFKGLSPETFGTLTWNDLKIGGDGQFPQTDAPVWLAPRDVDAATVQNGFGEAERYLFYRGVGNIRSPITVSQTPDRDQLVVTEDLPTGLAKEGMLKIPAMWLVHVRGNGQVAYRALGGADLTGTPGRELMRESVGPVKDLSDSEAEGAGAAARESVSDISIGKYSAENLAALRSEMREKLIADGLYEDEAEAMLKTWELAYFKSTGLRLFYIVPQKWTNSVLPLKCSIPADVSRTMVGRVEIVTPRQRQLIKRLGATRVTASNWLFRHTQENLDQNQAFAKLWEGKVRFHELNIAVPQDYQYYIDLGRFRNALLLDDATRDHHSEVKKFIEAYRIRYFDNVD